MEVGWTWKDEENMFLERNVIILGEKCVLERDTVQ